MPKNKPHRIFYDFLLTQKSIHRKMPYDVIDQVIQESIKEVKINNINAKISNIAFNINGRLVLGQIYVERKNGFAPTQEAKYGTSPTSYNVQMRFPFGLETSLGQKAVCLPSGDFRDALEPYQRTYNIGFRRATAIKDEVQRDYNPDQIICGPGVEKTYADGTITLTAQGSDPVDSVTFSVMSRLDTYNKNLRLHELGKGYEVVSISGSKTQKKTDKDQNYKKEYKELEDYDQRLKMAGVYPLFYSTRAKEREGLLRAHRDYKGSTVFQGPPPGTPMTVEIEPNDGEAGARKDAYLTYIKRLNEEIISTSAGQRWSAGLAEADKDAYLCDITIINGTPFFTQSGLPLTRLRDYQLDLFHHCLSFIEEVDQQNQRGIERPGLAGTISMGVGAGKTFFTFTLLQYLRAQIPHTKLTPPFCLAPNKAVAEVTEQSINRQGITTGTTAAAISSVAQIPSQNFLVLYTQLANQAKNEAKAVDAYIQNGLQKDILDFCLEHNLHPHKYIDRIYETHPEFMSEFKNSIDMKRLLLMVEGQKTILKNTKMLGIAGLKNLAEQFTLLEESIQNPDFGPYRGSPNKYHIDPNINYDQRVALPTSIRPHGINFINLCTIDPVTLKKILEKKYNGRLEPQREVLIRIACCDNNEAAVLLANSGGLGNTYSPEQLQQQIDTFLPIAANRLNTLANQKYFTNHDHHTMFLYLKELFSTIPSAIDLKGNLITGDDRSRLEQFQEQLEQEAFDDHKRLVTFIKKKINENIKALSTVGNVIGDKAGDLTQLGITENMSVIEAANQLAGIASLSITGVASENDAELLLSHIPVFTPEGLAAYFEHLGSLEGTPKIGFESEAGVYTVKQSNGLILKKDIAQRIKQVLNAVMIADEVHKEEFQFISDSKHPIHQKINHVTQKYLNRPFSQLLPHRIGMSGTINEVAEHAFGRRVLYNLSTQNMIQQGLVKQISSTTQRPTLTDIQAKSNYAQQIIVDYFTPNSTLSLKQLNHGTCVDLFTLSKGLIFSKSQDQDLTELLVSYFNLLIKDPADAKERQDQENLFLKINKAREKSFALFQQKSNGDIALSPTEHANIQQCTKSIHNVVLEKPLILNSDSLRRSQKMAFQNNLVALYLEFILSKSASPKEYSDVIGLQNKLYENNQSLIQALQQKDKEITDILSIMSQVDPQSINQKEVEGFLKTRIKNNPLLNQMMCDTILKNKNKVNAFIDDLLNQTQKIPLDRLVTQDQNEFESGTTLVMLGSERERTGYSHEPVSLVVDVPPIATLQRMNDQVALLNAGKLDDIPAFLACLQALARDTFAYDEKNQAGGRALRTPYGHVNYIEYQTQLNQFIADNPEFDMLKLETQFQDIFTADEALAKEERASITFNREALLLLEQDYTDINHYYKTLRTRFARDFEQEPGRYEKYLQTRPLLFWAMKNKVESARAYLLTKRDEVFNEIKAQLDVEKQQPDKPQKTNIAPLAGIDELLKALKITTDKLQEQGRKGSPQYHSNYEEVAKAARILYTRLEFRYRYFKENPQELNSFIDNCITDVEIAEIKFGTHRGWHQLDPILRRFIGVLATLTVLPALIVTFASTHGYQGTFFNTPMTRSATKLSEFKEGIQKLEPQKEPEEEMKQHPLIV